MEKCMVRESPLSDSELSVKVTDQVGGQTEA